MKAIISHDIDHLTISEHLFSDTIVPKFIIRSKIELLTGKISLNEFVLRLADIFRNKWQNIDELIAFNNSKHITSAFFMGVDKGTGLIYSNAAATLWAKKITEQNAELFIHGIKFENLDVIQHEKKLFESVFQKPATGMRMHYVKKNETTLTNFSKAGYLFDSTVHAFEDPYKIGNMWEFPFQIMDGWVIENGKKWQSRNLHQCKEATKFIIEEAQVKGLNYLGIDFHDRYFNKSFKTWMDWYMWLVDYLAENKIQTISFKNAINELESKTVSTNLKQTVEP